MVENSLQHYYSHAMFFDLSKNSQGNDRTEDTKTRQGKQRLDKTRKTPTTKNTK